MIGHSLGANKPKQAAFSSRIITLMTLVFSLLIFTTLCLCRDQILSLYTDDVTVIEIAKESYFVFMIAFSFDWI